MTTWQNRWDHLRGLGVKGTLASALDHTMVRPLFTLTEWAEDLRLGVDTRGNLRPAELGIQDPDAGSYQPSSFRDLRRIMRELAIRPDREVLVDYGSGKGRVLIEAARHPFRRVLGIEICPQLSEIARTNLLRNRHRHRCPEVAVAVADAARFPPPRDATMFFFYNPFWGDCLRAVMALIRRSLDEHPRPVTIIYLNPPETLQSTYPWLRAEREWPAYPGRKVVKFRAG
jgi:16S rRNA G966 N2-methylase RsmD